MNPINKGIAITLLLGTISLASSAIAKTTSKTISVTATITNGSTVSVSIVGDSLHESSANNGASSASAPGGQPVMPIVRIGFDMERPAYFVKRVTWDKPHRQLTIDF
jgi:hypothetical protein